MKPLLRYMVLLVAFAWIAFFSPQFAKSAENLPLRTFFVTRSLGHEKLLPYLREARPQVVQIGNYGAMFHGFADDPKSTGWPMQLPVAGEREALEFQRGLNAEVHALGLKVVGHFRLGKVMGDWEEQSGYVEYYYKRWPEDLLGKKPHPDLLELLQRDADGKPNQTGRYGKAQLELCLTSPHTREMFKRMLKVAVDNGVDGVMTNFNYYDNCACPYCQESFKKWLEPKLTKGELEAQLGIADLSRHTFQHIPAKIPGYPDPETAGEIEWLASQWAASNFKEGFDEVFIKYGRKLKPGLLVGQWNHLGNVGISEERMFLPLPGWNRDEDYFWYSGGASFVGNNLNLLEHKAGDAWLSCLYVRELAGGKPFVLGKYEGIRLAASMAEGLATGGIGMGRYMRFEDPVGYEVLSRYTRFVHQNRQLFDNLEVHADVGLVLPRQSVWNRHPESLDAFRSIGQALLEKQVLVDVVADENLTDGRLARYPAIILPQTHCLSDSQLQAIRSYALAGGKVLSVGVPGLFGMDGKPRNPSLVAGLEAFLPSQQFGVVGATQSFLETHGTFHIEAPWTVRAAAYSGQGRFVLHLVNYNRDEGDTGKRSRGPIDEKPIPVSSIPVRLRLPSSVKAAKGMFHSPDIDAPVMVGIAVEEGLAKLEIPGFTVYGVVEVLLGN